MGLFVIAWSHHGKLFIIELLSTLPLSICYLVVPILLFCVAYIAIIIILGSLYKLVKCHWDSEVLNSQNILFIWVHLFGLLLNLNTVLPTYPRYINVIINNI